MTDRPPLRYPRSFVFLLVPDFSMMPFTAAMEPLRVANRMYGEPVYRWQTASIEGSAVRASNGALVQVDSALSETPAADAIIVCSGIDVYKWLDPRLTTQLRRLRSRGSMIGSVCTGSTILASAGLLDDHRCTVHWEEIETLSENFPKLHVTRSLFEMDGDLFTCSGGMAPLDLMLHFIGSDFGRDLGARVADQMLYHMARQASEPQRLALSERTGVRHSGMLDIVSAMEANLENPLPLKDLAKSAQISPRQMERLFMRDLKKRPAQYYRELRLKRARQMVQQTGMSMMQIAVATGFATAAHFARAYRMLHGVAPSKDRAGSRTLQSSSASAR